MSGRILPGGNRLDFDGDVGAAVGVVAGKYLAAVCFGKILLIDGLLMRNPNITVTVDAVVARLIAGN